MDEETSETAEASDSAGACEDCSRYETFIKGLVDHPHGKEKAKEPDPEGDDIPAKDQPKTLKEAGIRVRAHFRAARAKK